MIAIEEWPSRSCTTFGCTPEPRANVAHVCLARAATQNFTSSVPAHINWDTEHVDDLSVISVPQTQISPNVAGWYGVSATIDFNDTTGVRYVHIKLNNTFSPPYLVSSNINLGDWRCSLSGYFPMNGTSDYLVVEVFPTVTAVSLDDATFRMVYLGA